MCIEVVENNIYSNINEEGVKVPRGQGVEGAKIEKK